MDIQIRDVKPFEQYCIDEFSMCHDDGDFERDVLGFYESIETERLWRVWELQAAKAQAVQEGYILIPKKMPDEVNDHLWDFMTDNFVCTNDYGDSFMACDDFNLDKFYAELVKAQEPAND